MPISTPSRQNSVAASLAFRRCSRIAARASWRYALMTMPDVPLSSFNIATRPSMTALGRSGLWMKCRRYRHLLLILKTRQDGISTFPVICHLDQTLFTPKTTRCLSCSRRIKEYRDAFAECHAVENRVFEIGLGIAIYPQNARVVTVLEFAAGPLSARLAKNGGLHRPI